jgi:hypothetical protein
MSNGVVEFQGPKPPEGTVVEVTAVNRACSDGNLSDDPAIGIWKDRTDLPQDASEAAKELGKRLMQRADEGL